MPCACGIDECQKGKRRTLGKGNAAIWKKRVLDTLPREGFWAGLEAGIQIRVGFVQPSIPAPALHFPPHGGVLLGADAMDQFVEGFICRAALLGIHVAQHPGFVVFVGLFTALAQCFAFIEPEYGVVGVCEPVLIAGEKAWEHAEDE